MLTYYLNSNQKTPMYEQLYENIKEDILNNKLKAHQKLPSKRNFAKHLKVSLITIENAYNQLLIEGYIYSIEKKGYYVNEIDFPIHSLHIPPMIEQKPTQKYLIDLKSNSILPKNFPFSTWAKLTREVLSTQDQSLLTRLDQNGSYVLRKAICHHLYSFAGMNVLPQQIIIGAGTEYLYNLVIQLLGRDYTWALENPGHQSISKVYKLNQVPIEYIPLDSSGLDIQYLQSSQAKFIHISPAHHYPTGITMPIKRRSEILNWAARHNAYIIEDDYDSELRLDGNPIPSLFQIDKNERVIYMNTFSKTLAPSFRISYMVLPTHLVSLYQEKLGFYACSVSSFEQIVLAHFIEKGYFEKHINRLRNSYKTLRNEFLAQLESSPLSSIVKIKEENAGLHFLLQFPDNYNDQDLLDKANQLGLHISTLSNFYHIPFKSHTLVINYSGLPYDHIKLAIELLEKLFNVKG